MFLTSHSSFFIALVQVRFASYSSCRTLLVNDLTYNLYELLCCFSVAKVECLHLLFSKVRCDIFSCRRFGWVLLRVLCFGVMKCFSTGIVQFRGDWPRYISLQAQVYVFFSSRLSCVYFVLYTFCDN